MTSENPSTSSKPLPMRVWYPDGTITKVMSITTSEEHVGNLVAEGILPEDLYWERLAKA